MQDHACGNLCGRFVVGAVQGHGTDGMLLLLPTRYQAQVILDALAVAAVLVFLAAAAGTGGVAGKLLAAHGASPCRLRFITVIVPAVSPAANLIGTPRVCDGVE
jgi:hypothetical protein